MVQKRERGGGNGKGRFRRLVWKGTKFCQGRTEKVKGWCERHEAPLHPATKAGYQNSSCLGIKSRREVWGRLGIINVQYTNEERTFAVCFASKYTSLPVL